MQQPMSVKARSGQRNIVITVNTGTSKFGIPRVENAMMMGIGVMITDTITMIQFIIS